jgi:excisionase family DNA binding protein
MSAPIERPYSVKEYARRLGVSSEVIYRWIKSGHLSCLRLPGGDIRIRQRDAAAFEREDGVWDGQSSTGQTTNSSKLETGCGKSGGQKTASRDPVALGREMRRLQRLSSIGG